MHIRNLLPALMFLGLFGPLTSTAQNITGIWRGYFITDHGEQYKLEFQADQKKTNSISGVTYSYLTTVFYGKATTTGFVKPTSKTVLVQEIKTVELKMSSGSVSCIMKYNLTYTRSGKEEFLEGTYTSTYEKSTLGARKGGDCGSGKVYLRKVPTSDFYIEPFLRDKPVANKSTPQVRTNPPVTKAQPKVPPVSKPPVQKPRQQTTATVPKKDSVVKRVATTTNVTIDRPKTELPKMNIPPITRSRKNELAQSLVVRNEEVLIKLYDNGEIDGDTISVYHNGQAVLSSKRLSAQPLRITLKMDDNNSEHVLIMVAENMGRIPPNTSLMIVEDGDKRYEVKITSTEQKNAMVRFRFERAP
jgi:hypothetical protein